ncbi:MBOAT family O-acyltransferase [Ferruginibacter sp.]
MLFNSFGFVIFFAVVAIVHFILPAKARWVWLLLSSTFFYMYASPVYIWVPALIILVSYLGGIQIEKASSPKKAQRNFVLCLIANIGVLVFFKYTNFLTTQVLELANFINTKLLHSGTVKTDSLLVDIAAPLGISYITFQAIGYLIEIKRGNHKAERNIGHFASFILFFPKIISGPIERAHNFLPQLKKAPGFDLDRISEALKIILWGFFKKVVIADRLSIYTNAVFNNYQFHNGNTLFVASIFYTIQLYADFSGYTDMAVGVSKLLGFDIIQNFNRPFFAKSVSEFWRRWHISLSTWFAEYFYTPLAMSKRDWGNWSVPYASLVTFVVLGFWHGANWTFIVFGALQGVVLSLEFFTKKSRKKMRKKIPAFINDWGGIFLTFMFINFAEIFFRADSVTQALVIIKKNRFFQRLFILRRTFYADILLLWYPVPFYGRIQNGILQRQILTL